MIFFKCSETFPVWITQVLLEAPILEKGRLLCLLAAQFKCNFLLSHWDKILACTFLGCKRFSNILACLIVWFCANFLTMATGPYPQSVQYVTNFHPTNNQECFIRQIMIFCLYHNHWFRVIASSSSGCGWSLAQFNQLSKNLEFFKMCSLNVIFRGEMYVILEEIRIVI